MAIGSTRPLEDATRIAYRELVLWMVADYGFDKWDAYMMLSQCGKVRLGNFVDPKYTVRRGHSKDLPYAIELARVLVIVSVVLSEAKDLRRSDPCLIDGEILAALG